MVQLIRSSAPPLSRVEVVRSFAYKLNVGNYESRDFFCSEKSECAAEDAPEVSAALYQFCKTQVLEAVKEYRRDLAEQQARVSAPEKRRA